MLSLLIIIAFGLGMAYFATQNTGAVDITFANYVIQAVPLYGIVIGSILLGIFISSLISMVQSISSALRIRGKETELRNANKTIQTLKRENTDLSLKNNRLKDEQEIPHPTEEIDHDEPNERPSFFERIKHRYL